MSFFAVSRFLERVKGPLDQPGDLPAVRLEIRAQPFALMKRSLVLLARDVALLKRLVQLVAVVESFRRSGVRIDCRKSIAYALYARLQTSSRLLRKATRTVVKRFKRSLKYLLQKKKRPSS